MVDWDKWQTLLAVFRNGTYSRAAKTLGVDATTVGRRLKQLENHVGYRLFLRQDGRLYPSHRCELLLSHMETASEALRTAEQENATTNRGAVWRTLRLTAVPYLIRNLFAPALASLTQAQRIRVELLGVVSNVNLSKREADIAVRLDDRPPDLNVMVEKIGVLAYATYCATGGNPRTLPWAGLMEQHVRTSEGDAMVELAGSEGIQCRAYHFDALAEIAASGVAQTMLPRFAADNDARLVRVSDTVLEQPVWMLYHRQDHDVPHLEATRTWVRGLALDNLCDEVPT